MRAGQLFDAACELFAERGYHDVDVTDIASHVGVSSGTFYNYYANKRALLDAIMRTQMDEYAKAIGRIEDGAVSTRGEFISAFEHMLRRTLVLIAANPQLSSFVALTAPGVDRDAYNVAMQGFGALSSQFSEFFEHGMNRGWVRDDVSMVVAGRAAASCLIMAVSPLLLGDRVDLDVDEVAPIMATYLLGGMRNA